MVAATNQPDTTGAGRVRGLDGLRAIAALAIVFHHVGFQSGATYRQEIWGGYLGRLDIGVPVFFALSGFLLFRPIAASVLDDTPLRPALEHLWRRAMRIYPAFWVALTLIVVFTSEAFADVTRAITTYLLVHIHYPTTSIEPMPQAWSLATEISFYAALPLMARFLRPWLRDRSRAARRNGLLVFIAACYLLSVFFRIAVLTMDTRWTSAQVLWLPGTLDYFAIGMALAVARVGFTEGSGPRRRLEQVAGPAGLWWIAAAVLFHVVSQHMGLALGVDSASWPREIARQMVYGAIGFCLLFPLVFGSSRRSLVRSFVRSPPMEWLGTISYSIYLWHMAFVVHPWEPLADRFGAVRDTAFWDYAGTDFWSYLVIALVPTLVVSIVSYYVVEVSGQRLQGLVRRPRLDPTPSESFVTRLRAQWVGARFRTQLLVISGVGFVGRVLYVILAKHDQTLSTTDIAPGDQFFYSRAADALAAGEGFVTPWQDIAVKLGLADPGEAAAHAADHPPLTALVAAPASFLPGGRGEHLFEQRFIMCAVGAAVIVMVGLLAREIAGRAVGIIAAVLAALYPGFWINDGLVMAESLTALTVAGALYAAARYRRAPSGRLAAELGLWIGFAALARAESLLLIPLVVVPLLWVTHPGWRDRFVRAVLAGGVTALVVAPWVVPNLVRFEEPVVMSHGDGLVLVGANNDAVYRGGGLGFWSPPMEFLTADGRFDETDPSVDSLAARDQAIEYIGEHLGDQPRVMAARFGRLWSVYRPLETAALNTQEGREQWASHLSIGALYLTLPLALLGWWRLGRGWSRWLLGIMVVHVSLMGVMFYGIPRFRVPAEVALMVAAAIGVHWLASLGACRPPRTSSSPASSS
ncbi:MAG: acyltransferase family protein [Acidimicrobiales bacterium]